MKVVIQRVKEAKVEVENKVVGKIKKGFLVFLGITHTDTKEQADYLVKKLCNLRVFTDREGKMNLGLKEVLGELLIVFNSYFFIKKTIFFQQFFRFLLMKSNNDPAARTIVNTVYNMWFHCVDAAGNQNNSLGLLHRLF